MELTTLALILILSVRALAVTCFNDNAPLGRCELPDARQIVHEALARGTAVATVGQGWKVLGSHSDCYLYGRAQLVPPPCPGCVPGPRPRGTESY